MELKLSTAGEAGEEDTGSPRIRSATLGPLSLRPGGMQNLVVQLKIHPRSTFPLNPIYPVRALFGDVCVKSIA